MKKSLLALAVLGGFASVAAAQSTVTLFGIVDMSLRKIKNGNVSQNQMANDALNSNRLGFRGTEDLGGGLRAGFWIEGAMTPDNGTAAGQTWQRRSTVSLLGGFGEVRLGRDYSSTFWNTTIFDPFGTNGVGSYLNTTGQAAALGTGATTYVRTNNMVGYFLPPNLGGIYGQLQTSAGEGVNTNKQSSGRIGYAAGPVNVAVAYGVTDTAPNEYKVWNIAGSYNFGFMNLMALYDMQEAGPREQKAFLVGAVIPLGQGELKFSYVKADASGGGTDANDADQIAAGYIYNLSKRTAIYGHVAQIKNDGAAAFVVGAGPGSAAGTKSRGYEVGLRHSF